MYSKSAPTHSTEINLLIHLLYLAVKGLIVLYITYIESQGEQFYTDCK